MKNLLWLFGSCTKRMVVPVLYAKRICLCMILVVMIAPTTSSLFGQRVVGTISRQGLQPWGVAVYEAGAKAFIADHATIQLLIYDENTLVLLGQVSIDGAGGSFMVVDESRGKLYAGGAQKIAVVNTVTGAFIGYLSGTYENLFGLISDDSLGKIYTLSIEGLRQIDSATDSITVIPGFGGGGYESIAVNPVTHEVFVTRYIQDVLVIIDGVTLSQTTVTGLGGLGVAANWKENKVYISYSGVNSVGKPLLSVYNRNGNTSSNILTPNDATEVFYNSSSNRVYTDSEVNAVSTIIEGASDSAFNLPIPSATTALGFRHATNHVYYVGREFIGVLDEATQLLELIPINNPTPAAMIHQNVAINQSTGRVYVINDANTLNVVTVLQDTEIMTRPPVFLGSIGFPATLHVIDPVTKVVVDTWHLFSGFQDVHQIAVRPGGGRLYVPHVSPFNEEVRIFAGAGQSSLADPTSRFAGRLTSGGGFLNGALVRALQAGEEKANATTNASGDYCIFNLKPGTYDIEVSADGHLSQSLQNQSVASGQTRVLHVRMTTDMDVTVETPEQFSLIQNYPNPFNSSTTIKYELPKVSEVRLSAYDLLGREVSVLANERMNAGVHEVRFDGSNLASGVYFYRLQAGDFIQAKRLVIAK